MSLGLILPISVEILAQHTSTNSLSSISKKELETAIIFQASPKKGFIKMYNLRKKKHFITGVKTHFLRGSFKNKTGLILKLLHLYPLGMPFLTFLVFSHPKKL